MHQPRGCLVLVVCVAKSKATQEALGCDVLRVVTREKTLGAESAKGVTDYYMRGLGRKALAPVWR